MDLSRRNFFRAGAAAGLAAAAVSGIRLPHATAATTSVATLAHTLAPGEPGAGGYRPVVEAAGEAHKLRTDLGVVPDPGRAERHKPLSAFAQLSDVHIIDAQSPLRVEWVDRLDDPSTLPAAGLFTSAYRPQEMLSGQIARSMVDQLNDIGVGPVTGKPLAFAIQTGDNSDNSQRNEVRWNIDLLSGGTVRVDSGDLTRWEGVADNDLLTYDPAYWHPEPTPLLKPKDYPKRDHGFPTVPGLLDAARRPFQSQGLNMEWFSVFGNHDGLIQGNFPHTMQLDSVATGSLKIISPPLGVHPGQLLDQFLADPTGLLASLALTPGVRRVTADPDREPITRAEIVEEHFATAGQPVGHGFTETNRAEGTAYYTVDRAGVRLVVLDTVNPNGYYNGSLDEAQFDWLTEKLERSTGKIVIIASHHNSATMDNPFVATGGDLSPRVTRDAVLDLLLDHPEVVAWINGHTHTNRVAPHVRTTGGGFWEITTASHIDWPQQSRLVELTDNADGTLSIFTTMVDHGGPPSAGAGLESPPRLAGLGRELALNDWHTHDSGSGSALDRNVELVVADPRG